MRESATSKAPETLPDWPFYTVLGVVGATYVFLIVAMLVADLFFTTPGHFVSALRSPEIRYSIQLSLFSCTVTTFFSLLVAVPMGYLMSRFSFRGKYLLDALLDVPIVLPPLVMGLSLLILFQTAPGKWVENYIPFTYAVPGVILAQFSVASAFAVRTMIVAFDQITPRTEQVALTLGCNRMGAFFRIALPEARRGIFAAATIAWARSLGEFGPILIFAGATRNRTEVLSSTIFLELSIGNIEAAVAVSILMIAAALVVLGVTRKFGLRSFSEKRL